jgi:hypothetical protein
VKLQTTAFLTLLAGLVGAMLSRYIAPAPVFAQNQPAAQREVRSQSFILTDEDGNTAGVFTLGPRKTGQKRAIILLDQEGTQIWSAGESPLRRLSQR